MQEQLPGGRFRPSMVSATPAHLTSKHGGNAKGLSGTILAMCNGPLSPLHGLRDTCTSMCNGIRTPGRLPVNGFQDYGSPYPTLPVDANESLYRGLLGV